MRRSSLGKHKIPQRKRQFRQILWQKQNGLCCYCNQPMQNRERTSKDINLPDDATLDHVFPKSKGGIRNHISNLRLCCFKCNQAKNDTLLEEHDVSSHPTSRN